MLTQALTRLGPGAAFAAAVIVLAQVENPYWTAACLAVFAAQPPIQRAILAWDAKSARRASQRRPQKMSAR